MSVADILIAIEKFSDLITWAFVVFGWIVVNCFNKARERNKDYRALIDSIRQEVIELEKLGVAYHSTQKQKFDLTEFDIVSRFELVMSRIEYVSNGFARAEFIEFKKSITLNNFQVAASGRLRYEASSQFVENIRNSSKNLQTVLERKFFSLY